MEENKNTDMTVQMELDNEKKKQKILYLLLILLIIIITLLLFQRFSKIYSSGTKKNPTGNIDIFEIKCDSNASCSEDKKKPDNNYSIPNTDGDDFSQSSTNTNNEKDKNNSLKPTNSKVLDSNSLLSNIIISNGNLNFNSNITTYIVNLSNEITYITLTAYKESEKSTLTYILDGKIYSDSNNLPIKVGENILTIIVVAEDGTTTNYKIVINKLEETGATPEPVIKDNDSSLSDIITSSGNLKFDKNKTNYTIAVDNEIEKITVTAKKSSEKSTLFYVYNKEIYEEIKDIPLQEGENIITIVVTAEDGTTTNYVVTINRRLKGENTDSEGITWKSVNQLNIFSNPLYNMDSKIAPLSTNSYEFIIRNTTKEDVLYSLEFNEKSDFPINMKYRLKRNNEYIKGNEQIWVSYNDLNLDEIDLAYNRADDYVLDWKWFDGENDNLIGSLQDDYTLSITLAASTKIIK